MAKSKFIEANQKIAEGVTGGYKKIEGAVVGGYTKIEDKFVDQFLTREGETMEDAKERLKTSQTPKLPSKSAPRITGVRFYVLSVSVRIEFFYRHLY